MHDAVCSDCGNPCQVPFRPAPGRDVFCNNCFRKDDFAAEGGFEGKKAFKKPHRSEFDEDDGFAEKRMYGAVCANCGEECEVPFKPFPGRDIYCSNCFKKGESSEMPRKQAPSAPSFKPDAFKAGFDQLGVKLDRIIKLLEAAQAKPASVKEEEAPVAEAPKKPKKAKKKSE